jgi:hypothetical protein
LPLTPLEPDKRIALKETLENYGLLPKEK